MCYSPYMPYRKVKPMPNEKVERNLAVAEYAERHPEATLQIIGDIFGVNRRRVFSILRQVAIDKKRSDGNKPKGAK